MLIFGRTKKHSRHAWRSAFRLQVENLEDRRLLALNPAGLEQEMLESINRMRMDPAGELDVLFLSTNPGDADYFQSPDSDVNLALNFFNTDAATLFSQWSTLTAAPPLSWNEALYDAATGHSDLMIAQNSQSHQLPGEPSLLTRAENAGYDWGGSVSVGENVFAFTESVFHGHAAFAIDWGTTPSGIQNPPGHRENIMDADWVEMGIGVRASTPSSPGDVGPLVVTQDFGYRSNYGNPKVLGVVFTDGDSDGLYDAGEGQGGITITVSNASLTYTTTTMSAGGYQVAVVAGTYNVQASGGSLAGPVSLGSITVGADNIKVDLDTNDIPASATLSGTVYHDADEDGLLDPADGELSGWTVFLDTDADGQLGPGETSATTGVNGQYSLQVGSSGSYSVAFVDQYGYRLSDGGSPSHSVTVSLGEAVTSLDFALYRYIQTVGSRVNIFGTRGADEISWQAGTTYQVVLNGESHSFDGATYDTFHIYGRAGTDTLNVTAGAGDDTATINLGSVSLASSDYTVQGTVWENINVDLGTGANDQASVYDTAADDDMIAHPTWGRLIGDSYNYYVANFDRMNTYATAGGIDRAYVYDGPTDDRFIGRTDFSILHGSDDAFYSYMEGFELNFAYATGGGNDYAFFYDSEADDRFFGLPAYSAMQDTGATYFNYASGFDRVFAYATAGGADYAFLTDAASDDRFTARSDFSVLQGVNLEFYHEVRHFERVNATATGGGDDFAFLYDTTGNDRFYGHAEYSWMQDVQLSYRNSARGFDKTFGYATAGGTDYAYLTGSTGNDRYYGRETYSIMRAQSYAYYNEARMFDRVYANANGGTDYAYVYDSAGDDLFFGYSTHSILRGSNFQFYHNAKDFDQVVAYANNGGQDTAFLQDSAGDDLFFGRTNYGYLSGDGFLNRVNSFDAVDLSGDSGGANQLNVDALDYVLSVEGEWT